MNLRRYEGCVDSEGVGVEMERLAAEMGGTTKWPYNDSECLDADFFKVVADNLITKSGIRLVEAGISLFTMTVCSNGSYDLI